MIMLNLDVGLSPEETLVATKIRMLLDEAAITVTQAVKVELEGWAEMVGINLSADKMIALDRMG